MAVTLGVDFGTRNIEICQNDKGIVLREPNIAAVDTVGNVVAIGTEALLTHGRAPGTVTLRRPIIDNTITDFNLAAEILDHALETAAPRVKKHILAPTKQGFGARNRELLIRALGDCRTGKITLVDSAATAWLGCDAEPLVEEPDYLGGTIICDIGAGSVEASYIRMGEILRTETVHGGGDSSDSAMISYIRSAYSLTVTPADVREAKHTLSLVNPEPSPIEFSGVDTATGMPRRITVPAKELLNDCTPHIDDTVNVITSMLKNLPHHGENISVADRIILVGGGALTEGMGSYISEAIGREVIVADDPLDATARGLMIMMNR
ncbi:MAG: rod shape-determining protein [Clostridia bacterium]|nr:rod shape-determining protein [Clostridia bacterium]